MDSTSLCPALRIWYTQHELKEAEASSLRFSIHPDSCYNKILVSRPRNSEHEVLHETEEPIRGRDAQEIQPSVIYDDTASYTLVSNMLCLIKLDDFDRAYLIGEIISTARKIMDRIPKEMGYYKFFMDVEINLTTVSFCDDGNNFKEGMLAQ